MLLVDTGLVGFLFYVVPFVYLVRLAWKRDRSRLFYLALMLVELSAYTHAATPTGNVLYWMFVATMYCRLTRACARTGHAVGHAHVKRPFAPQQPIPNTI
jgi:hypothetical protein